MSAGNTSTVPSGLGSLVRHKAYRASGVPWVGAVPAHWRVLRNQFLFYPRREVVGENAQDQLLSLTLKGVIPRSVEEGKGKFPENFDTYQRAAPGDVVFCLFDIDETPRTVGVARQAGMVTGAYTVVRCRDTAVPGFVAYFYESLDQGKQLRPLYSGLRKVIRPTTFLHAKMPAPPPDEQQAIVSFLDRETAKIDALIAKKERLIELLQEKRTAFITHAVTKSLDPNALTKPSGIDWLGDIPAHWEVRRLRSVTTRVQTGTTPPTSEGIYYEDATIPWYGPGSFTDDLLLAEAPRRVSQIAVNDGRARIFEPGSTLIVTIGATIGKVGLTTISASSNQQITAVAPDERLLRPAFLAWQLKTRELWLRGVAPSTTIPILDQQDIKNIEVVVAPHGEQDCVLAHVKEQVAKIARLRAALTDAIETLKELRGALISSAITGKIDVRGTVE